MKIPGLIVSVLNVIGSAQGEWAPVKLVASTKCKVMSLDSFKNYLALLADKKLHTKTEIRQDICVVYPLQ